MFVARRMIVAEFAEFLTMSQVPSTIMPPKKKTPSAESVPKRRGRPKAGGRITSRYSIITSPEYRVWVTEFLAFLGESEVSDVYRDAMRRYAESKGFRAPPPK